jgi:hypothetical protein
MGYRHISNLYKNKEILMFRECYATEKIHGTSAHVSYVHSEKKVTIFSGGAKHEHFINLFDQEKLLTSFSANCEEHSVEKITVYGEAYGGKLQGMKDTYGPELKFIAFEVLIEDKYWMEVPRAEAIANKLGFEFVAWEKIETSEEAINAAMMADSVQAVRNGMGSGKMREGVVLRPLIELVHQDGGRVICKHKRPEFAEREHTPKFSDSEDLKVLEDAKKIAEEWVTPMRLVHVLDAFPNAGMENVPQVITAMVEDVFREGAGEIAETKAARKAIGKKTVKLFKDYLEKQTFNG